MRARTLLAASIAIPGAVIAVLAVPSVSPAPSATGATDPCAASEVARTIGSVAKSTGDYLDSHPETNQAMTNTLQQPAGPQSLASLKTYLEANPKVAVDLGAIAQPLTKLSDQCKLPITIPQAIGLAQAAQGGAGLPGLPGAPAGGTPPSGGTPATPSSAAVPSPAPTSAPPRSNNAGR
jgi:heme-binding protein